MLLPEETTQNGVEPEAPPTEPEQVTEPPQSMDAVQAEDLLGPDEAPREAFTMEDAKLRAVLEAIVYITDQPLSLEQICTAIEQPRDRVIDMPLFTGVAPCMNNFLVAQRFEDAAADGSTLDDVIDYVFTLRMRPVRVKLRLLTAPGRRFRYVLVKRAL